MGHAQIRTSYDLGPEGRILIVTTRDDPAAGAEFSVTVPGSAVWRVIAIAWSFVTDATVATRFPRLEVTDGESVFTRMIMVGDQTASLVIPRFAGHGLERADGAGGGVTSGLLNPLIMLPGWVIRSVTSNMVAGDNYAAPILYVSETPQRGLAAGQDALRSALRRLIGEEA